jgi:hypothetical protein
VKRTLDSRFYFEASEGLKAVYNFFTLAVIFPYLKFAPFWAIPDTWPIIVDSHQGSKDIYIYRAMTYVNICSFDYKKHCFDRQGIDRDF